MHYDVTVIGSGPGGYVAAIRCAQLGFRTAIIEKYHTLGGTCLNVGCIPSKALLDSSEHFHNAATTFETHGIGIGKPKVVLAQMLARKDDVVKQNCDGIEFLMKKNRIEVHHGLASFVDANTISISDAGGKPSHITSDKVIVATGSKPASLPFIKVDKKRVITSTEALALKEVPKHLVIIGGGVVGLELGSVYARLGAEVSVVEYLDRIIPSMDAALSRELKKSLTKLGFKFYLKHKVTGVEAKGSRVSIAAQPAKGENLVLNGDYCLVSIGRRAYTDGLGLERAGIDTDEAGRIATDARLRTSADNIYAIGDVVKGAMLAHKAEEEGTLVAEQLAGQKPHINYNLIPSVVYTWPEAAGVGATEEQLKAKGLSYKAGSFPFRALGRARASMDMDGLVKVLADKNTDEILGVHIIGARAADMIASAVTAMEYRASAEDVARMPHAHPTYMEAMKEACLAAADNRPIHI